MDELVRRAQALLEVDRPADAVPLLERCLAERPDSWVQAEALVQLGRALLALGRGEEALSVADRLVGLMPDLAQGHLGRGLALSHLDRPEEALAACATAVRNDPDGWWYHAQYAVLAVRVTAASGDAMRAARTACELAPGEPQAHLILGVVAGRLGRPEEADEAYRRVLRLDPGNAAARANLAADAGWALALRPHIDAFSSVLRMDPMMEQARHNLERIAIVALRRAYWLSAAVLVLCSVAATRGADPLRAVLGTVGLGLLGLLAWRLWARTAPGARTFVVARFRQQRFLQVSALLTVVMVLATLWAAYAPLPEWFVPWVLRPLGFAGIAMLVADVLRRD